MFKGFLIKIILIVLAQNVQIIAAFDLFGSLSSLGSASYNILRDNAICSWRECCDDRTISKSFNRSSLYDRLNKSLFGQHIVAQQLLPALNAHFSSQRVSSKPLVLSFHGTPGTGKNFVAGMVAETIFEEGIKSKFVHTYMGRSDFPLESDVHLYKARINSEVREAIRQCPYSLFIFDEVDKIPEGVFESLTSLLNYNLIVNGQDYTKAIFIFLTNTGGLSITDRLASLIKKGSLREETRLSDFEQILTGEAYNTKGGFRRTSLIDVHVIDHYLPFLPLEKKHVSECISAEFKKWYIMPTETTIEAIIQNAIVYDKSHGLFSTTGCKTLEKKVAVEVSSRHLLK